MFAIRRHRKHVRPLTWLALLAMLALALLPTLSHALAFAQGRGDNWAEVCTPQGTRLVAVQAGDSASGGAPLQVHVPLEHCPFCALGATALGPPPAPLAAVVLPLFSDKAPALFLHAPRTLFAWRSAQPRGPPFIS